MSESTPVVADTPFQRLRLFPVASKLHFNFLSDRNALQHSELEHPADREEPGWLGSGDKGGVPEHPTRLSREPFRFQATAVESPPSDAAFQ